MATNNVEEVKVAPTVAPKEVKEFKQERFDFALYVNDNLICKRNFRIYKYIEGSMQSINFKETIDKIVSMIDDDLKSKSRVYTWYYYDENDVLEEFKEQQLQPWECTFKFEVTDNGKLVMARIWDGYGYPKAIREKVDISNKSVKVITKDGRQYVYDKETYFKENEGRLNAEMYVLKAMINDKPDLLSAITRKICETCSPREDLYTSISDYTTNEDYRSRIALKNEDGTPKLDKNGEQIYRKTAETKRYHYSTEMTNSSEIARWRSYVEEKTKKYFENLY